MGNFRIAFGTASCRDLKSSDQLLLAVSSQVLGRIEKLKSLNASQLMAFRKEEQETLNIEGKKIRLTTYNERIDEEKCLIVIQAFYNTFKRPNYLSFSGIGRLLAEGIVVTADGKARDARDEELLCYR